MRTPSESPRNWSGSASAVVAPGTPNACASVAMSSSAVKKAAPGPSTARAAIGPSSGITHIGLGGPWRDGRRCDDLQSPAIQERDDDRPRVDQAAGAARDEREDTTDVRGVADGERDIDGGLEPAHRALELVTLRLLAREESGVLDRDGAHCARICTVSTSRWPKSSPVSFSVR